MPINNNNKKKTTTSLNVLCYIYSIKCLVYFSNKITLFFEFYFCFIFFSFSFTLPRYVRNFLMGVIKVALFL